MALPQCRLVIFDKDGTLLDDAATWASPIEQCAKELSPLISGGAPHFLEIMGFDQGSRTFTRQSVFMTATHKELEDYLKKELGVDAAQAYTDFFAKLPPPEGVPVAPLSDVFNKLHKSGIQIAVLTSDNRGFTEYFLKKQGVLELVSTMVCGDDGLPPKPSAVPAVTICQRLKVCPSEAAMVGDSASRDIGCGLAAKLGHAIGVRTGISTKEDFRARGAHAVVPTIADVIAVLSEKHSEDAAL